MEATDNEPRLPGTEAYEGALYTTNTMIRRSKLAMDIAKVFDVSFDLAKSAVLWNEKAAKLALLDAELLLEADPFPPCTREDLNRVFEESLGRDTNGRVLS